MDTGFGDERRAPGLCETAINVKSKMVDAFKD